MPSSTNIESTIKEPIRFFLMYPLIDRNYLFLQYKKMDEYDGYYDSKKNVAYIKVETRIDEDVVKTSMVEFLFEDFIKNRFEEEILISKSLITEFYKKHLSKSKNELAYKKLLRAFVDNFQKFKNFPLNPESELLPTALIEIVKHAMHKYRGLFNNNTLEIQAMKIITDEEELSGQTGHNFIAGLDKQITNYSDLFDELSTYIRGINLTEFTNVIKHHSLSPGTPKAQWIGKRVDAHRFAIFLKMPRPKFNDCFFFDSGKKLRPNDRDKLEKQSEIVDILKRHLEQ